MRWEPCGWRFARELRHQWRSLLVIAILISVVGGLVLAATAAGRRTEAAFPAVCRRPWF